MFLAKTDAEPRMQESAEDMTAAATVPMPMMDTGTGTRYCITRGSTELRSESGSWLSPVEVVYEVWFQSGLQETGKTHGFFTSIGTETKDQQA